VTKTPLSIDTVISMPIKFNDTPLYVVGIYLPLSPDVQTEKIKHGNDYNFTSFSLITSMSRDEYYEKYKSKHADRKPFDACRDYEDYIRKLTSFVFEPSRRACARPNPCFPQRCH